MQRKNRCLECFFSSVFMVCVSTMLLSLCLMTGAVSARDVTFSWTANPENVDGYRIYYRSGSSGPPYDGTGAAEGNSPVDVGNVTSYTLRNLADTQDYYFALTAYLGTEESPYSTEISLPADSGSSGRSVTFSWTANPENVDGYRIYYRTGSGGPPYDGTGAAEGDSPIDVGNVTGYTLSGLSTTETYSFALAAYQGATESTLTDELVLAPVDSNSQPTAIGGDITLAEDSVYSGVLEGSDPDGDNLSYSIVAAAGKGSVVIVDAGSGSYTYTPAANVNGGDSFSFKVNDGEVDSAVATVNVVITPVNDPPIAIDGSLSTSEDAVATGQLDGDDIDNDPLSFSITANGAKGTATITNAATGAYTYVGDANANGSDSFSFVVSDGTTSSAPATVSVTIAPQNDPPMALAAAFSVDEDSSISGELSGNDVDGDPLTYSLAGNGSKGRATITNDATGAFTYTPDANVNGADSFSFRVSDATATSPSATVTVTITPVNDAPTVAAVSLSTEENTDVSGTFSGDDIDGDPLSYGIASQPGKGSVNIVDQAAGTFVYSPNTDANGSDSFTYTASDGTAVSPAATVTISIAAVNDPPVANAASISVDEDSIYTGTLSASDVDNDPLTFSLAGNGSLGTAAIVNPVSGAFTYTPNPNVSGSDSFTFVANDGTVNSAAATVAVEIMPVNDPPTAAPVSIATDENSSVSGQLSGSDVDDDPLLYAIVDAPSKGQAVITDAQAGTFIYTPDAGEYGSDSFTFKVNDGTADSPPATVSITINMVNSPPAAANFSLTTDRNTPVSDQLLADDVDGDALTFSLVSNAGRGTVVITDAATGDFTYTPGIDEVGEDSFTFKVNDGTEDSAAATVQLRILDESTLTAVFGDNYGSDYPGTIDDTFITATGETNSTLEGLRISSFGVQAPHTAAATTVITADLGAIASYATVVEARLVLYQSQASGAGHYSAAVHKIVGVEPVVPEATGFEAAAGVSWTPVDAGSTYNDVPLGLADIEAAEDTQLLFDQPAYRSWLITDMVQEWVAMPSSNSGLLLAGENTSEETERIFAASENTNIAVRPQLIVRYKLIPPPPSLIMIEEIK